MVNSICIFFLIQGLLTKENLLFSISNNGANYIIHHARTFSYSNFRCKGLRMSPIHVICRV